MCSLPKVTVRRQQGSLSISCLQSPECLAIWYPPGPLSLVQAHQWFIFSDHALLDLLTSFHTVPPQSFVEIAPRFISSALDSPIHLLSLWLSLLPYPSSSFLKLAAPPCLVLTPFPLFMLLSENFIYSSAPKLFSPEEKSWDGSWFPSPYGTSQYRSLTMASHLPHPKKQFYPLLKKTNRSSHCHHSLWHYQHPVPKLAVIPVVFLTSSALNACHLDLTVAFDLSDPPYGPHSHADILLGILPWSSTHSIVIH